MPRKLTIEEHKRKAEVKFGQDVLIGVLRARFKLTPPSTLYAAIKRLRSPDELFRLVIRAAITTSLRTFRMETGLGNELMDERVRDLHSFLEMRPMWVLQCRLLARRLREKFGYRFSRGIKERLGSIMDSDELARQIRLAEAAETLDQFREESGLWY